MDHETRQRKWTRSVVALAMLLSSGSFCIAGIGKMYWTAHAASEISRADLDGSNPEVVLRTPYPETIELDLVHDRMYWTESNNVFRASTDGSNVELLFSIFAIPGVHLAVDGTNGKLYYAHGLEEQAGLIGWADLDGGNRETIIAEATTTDVELDVPNAKMYFPFYDPFTDFRAMKRADLDGANVETLFELDGVALDIALDPPGGKIYWADDQGAFDVIRRANLDGTEVETLVTGLHKVFNLEIDLIHGKIYYTQSELDIRRANLDGSGEEVLVSDLWPGGVALDPLGEGGGVPAVNGRSAALLVLVLLIVSTIARSRW